MRCAIRCATHSILLLLKYFVSSLWLIQYCLILSYCSSAADLCLIQRALGSGGWSASGSQSFGKTDQNRIEIPEWTKSWRLAPYTNCHLRLKPSVFVWDSVKPIRQLSLHRDLLHRCLSLLFHWLNTLWYLVLDRNLLPSWSLLAVYTSQYHHYKNKG